MRCGIRRWRDGHLIRNDRSDLAPEVPQRPQLEPDEWWRRCWRNDGNLWRSRGCGLPPREQGELPARSTDRNWRRLVDDRLGDVVAAESCQFQPDPNNRRNKGRWWDGGLRRYR
jgi:hypothetical protein